MASYDQEIQAYGWTAVPRSIDSFLSTVASVKNPAKVTVDEIGTPDSKLARKTLEFARKELPEETFNHSMRVYYYCAAVLKTLFPAHPAAPELLETLFLTSLLHDIGTAPSNLTLSTTFLSFEFFGGMLALRTLKDDFGAPRAQAEAVAEAVIRHQDVGEDGTQTFLGGIIQVGTLLDNMGAHPELVSEELIEDVVSRYPRKKWSSCFAATIRKENGTKPWAHTTKLGEREFPEGVLGNKLMEPYE